MYYEKAIERPFTDKKKLLIGSLIYMVPWLNLLLNLFGVGYMLECAKHKKMPEWSNIHKLFMHGMIAHIIAVIYLIPALVIGYLTYAFNYLTAFRGFVAIVTLPESVFSIIQQLSFDITWMKIIVALSFYFIPAALIMYTKHYSFYDAFNCKELFKNTLRLKYLSAWVIALAYSVLVIILAGIVSGLYTTVLPFIVHGFAFFVIGVTFMTLFDEVI